MDNKTYEIDFDRKKRLGFPEVVFGESKATGQLTAILRQYSERKEPALATKVQEDKARQLLEVFPGAFYDEMSGVFGLNIDESAGKSGEVAIVSGGTSDAYVVNEAYYTLLHLGIKAERVQDVGVSGLHRLLNKIGLLQQYRVVIAVAGFEAALPTVLGGLIPQPIIAVPTSVGYGVASGGQAALNGLLASCANGLCVVNIDNGYGAAIAAFRMIKSMGKEK
ncbi:MAG: nickel pincer cofactor biosynthesis protein LarB [Cyclobacteriaceae bacterium]